MERGKKWIGKMKGECVPERRSTIKRRASKSQWPYKEPMQGYSTRGVFSRFGGNV